MPAGDEEVVFVPVEEAPKIREVTVAERVAEKIEKGVKEFAEKARKALGVAEAFSPKVARGIMLIAVTVPSIYLVASAVGAIAPYVTQYITAMAPFLVMAITMLIALTMVSLAIGLVRTLALG
ncbi:MAG: hypothetical protein LM583_08945 [Desulfurococcaceae archaeon]|nr:hypothetical protein [Desulfurococcaceae archaeon]